MTLRTLIGRSLRFHWRLHLGVTLGAAVGSAALIGALVVGDSVRGSLRDRALARVGHGSFLLFTGDRLFAEHFAARIRCQSNVDALRAAGVRSADPSAHLPVCLHPDKPARAMLWLRGAVVRADGAARANRVQVIGLSDFAPVLYPSSETQGPRARPPVTLTNQAVVNAALAAQLNLRPGEEILVRFGKWNRLSPEAAIAPRDQPTAALRMVVHAVVTNSELAQFSPTPTAGDPANIFVPLDLLAQAGELLRIGESLPVNLCLVPELVQLEPGHFRRRAQLASVVHRLGQWIRTRILPRPAPTEPRFLPLPLGQQLRELEALVEKSWGFDCVQMGTITLVSDAWSLTSPRVFLDPPLARAALAADANAQPVLTYLANLLQAGPQATPYSMVTAAGPPWTPADLRDDEILVSQWLAEDLRVQPGDEIALVYFDPESGARLVERTNMFRVRGIVPPEMPWADRTLMPDFPGIEKAESTRDWDAGFPLTYKIRSKDEEYWKQHRGTPKAFLTLAAGQKMWANRFGNLTAIRFPLLSPGMITATHREALERKILAQLKPEELGLRFEPVREEALRAARQSQDFGGLFLGFSSFLIAAALLLMALLFRLGLEQRAPEIGTMLALGFTPGRVRTLLLGEGMSPALLGGVTGALGGLAYARVMLHGLATVWRDAVGGTTLHLHLTVPTVMIGVSAGVGISALTIAMTLRGFVRRPARALLVGEVEEEAQLGHGVETTTQTPALRPASWLRERLVARLALVAALALVGWTLARGDTTNAGAFFAAGALVLVAGVGFVSEVLRGLIHPARAAALGTSAERVRAKDGLAHPLRVRSLAVRGAARRRSRSLATVAMLACGSFLIVSIGVFRQDATRDATRRTAGTGGFALIGETTLPVVHDLNEQAGRGFFALRAEELAGVTFVPFRVREGEDASCLNLNRAQRPRLLGVRPELLEERFTFTKGGSWQALRRAVAAERSGRPEPPDSSESAVEVIPAIGDANSIRWALGKQVGDTIDYVDERGRPFRVRILGAVANSILQGSLVIDEAEFVKRFPSESGYRFYLIDAPTNRAAEVSAALSRALQDVGLEVVPAAQRLAQFNAVQNTYLGTFQVLGGLGLLLGSAGLGIVLLRNVLERRGELAVLLAVGWRQTAVHQLLRTEYGLLLAAGLGVGILAAVVAVLPTVLVPGAQLPWRTLLLALATVGANGMLWVWLATRLALRGNLVAALRNE